MPGTAATIPEPLRASGWGVLALVLVVAAVARFAHPGVVEYRRDEANLSRLALRMARGEELPLLGIGSSVGVPNPPLSVWVFAPPYLLGNDPVRATQWVGLLGWLAVLATFLVARRWVGTGAALVAAAVFAAGPWPAIFARKIWAQDVLPVFAIATFAVGVRGLLRGGRWSQLLFLPLLSCCGQLYYGSFVLIPAALYLVWAGRRRLTRHFWAGAGLAALSVVPFAVGAARAWSALPPGAARAHLESEGARRDVHLSGAVLTRLRDVYGGAGALDFVGGEVRDLAPGADGPWEDAFRALGWAVLASCAWVVLRALRRGPGRELDRTLALWFLATPLAFAFSWTHMHPHYLIPGLPVGFVALGVALRDLAGALARRLGAGPLTAGRGLRGAALLLLLPLAFQLPLLAWLGGNATPGGFGIPLGRRLEVRDALLATGAPEVRVLGMGTDVVEDGEAAIWDVLLLGQARATFAPEGAPGPAAVTLRAGCEGAGEAHAMRPDPRTGRPEACFRVQGP